MMILTTNMMATLTSKSLKTIPFSCGFLSLLGKPLASPLMEYTKIQKYKIQNTKYRKDNTNTKYKTKHFQGKHVIVQNTKYIYKIQKLQSKNTKVQSTKYKIQK